MIQFLLGTWMICSTNFPMWTKGGKLHPTFNYSIVADRENVLFDEVKYVQKGKEKSIRGYDMQDPEDASKFTWRGKGLLFIAKSRWQVVLKDPQEKWAVIYFSKTLFTPEGVDIIAREKLNKEDLDAIKAQMQENELLQKHVSTLKDL